MFERILVPLDGTEHAERALSVAACITRATSGTLVLISVVLPPVEYRASTMSRFIEPHATVYETLLERASAYLNDVLQRHVSELVGIKTEQVVTSGVASSTIFEEAALQEVDLIVLCSQGKTGLMHWIFSGVARQAVRHSPVPVLVLNEHGIFPPFSQRERLLRVLVPLDGSLLSEAALEPTVRLMAALAGSTQTALHLLEVIDIPMPYGKMRALSNIDKMIQQEEVQKEQCYLHDVVSHLLTQLPTKLNITITSSIVTSMDCAKAILAEAEPSDNEPWTEPYDLIAMSTHGRGRLQQLLMGSVTEHILGATRLPLLVVRPHEASAQHEQHKQIIEVDASD